MSAGLAAWCGLLLAVVIAALATGSWVLCVGLAIGALLGYGTKDMVEAEGRRWNRER